MIIQIDYDLNKAGQNYEGLISKIKSIGSSQIRPCKSCWLVATTRSPEDIYSMIRPLIDDNDYLLVSRFYSKDYQGWLKKADHDWIVQHRSSLRDLT